MPTDRPNIILFMTDQQRGDCLGIEGHPAVQTPNLDSFADSGAHFRRAATECPSCIPARRTLMTGTAPAAHGMVGMIGHDWNPPHALAGELQKSGYQTKLIGKLHLAPKGKRYGFEHQELADGPYEDEGNEYVRWLKQRGHTAIDAGIAHGVDVNGFVGRPGHLPESDTMTVWAVDRAVEFLRNGRDPTAPFFLNVSIFDPHPPLVPPQWYYERYIQRDLPPPVVGDWATDPGRRPGYAPAAWRMHIDEQQMKCTRAAYYGTVNFIDDQFGRLMQYLRRNKLMDNTLILFTSDHGEMLGDHHLFRKCWPYEASSKIPFIIKPPRAWQSKSVSSTCPVGLQDVMPTFLDAAGVEIPEACTGKSVLPIVRNESKVIREVLHLEDSGTYESIDGYHALLGERYKYIWYSQRETEHLFDLEKDPNELCDLALREGSEAKLEPWRKRLTEVISNRPEGFVKEGKLIRGQPHKKLIPDYQPDRFFPYL